MATYTLEPDDRSPLPVPPARVRDWFNPSVRDILLWPTVIIGILWPVLLAVAVTAPVGPVVVMSGFALTGLAVLVAGHVWTHRRLLAAARRFRTQDRPTCVVHHCPRVHPTDVELAVASFERNTADLERAFGFPLRFRYGRRPRVYLFHRPQEVAAIYRGHKAFALQTVSGIVFSAFGFSPELVRHETAHLFTFTVPGRAPRVLEEGLAMWAQRTHHGRGLHEAARSALRETDATSPEQLLPANWTDDDATHSYRCYRLAGSFTGYLIGWFGWPAYWRLYRNQTPAEWAFRRRFKRQLGVSFVDARADWLAQLRAGKLTGKPAVGSFEPK